LLLEVEAGSLRGIAEYPSSNGFAVAPEPIMPGAHGRVRLCLKLAESTYHDQFCALAEDVLRALAGSVSEPAAVGALLSRLVAWQNFFQRHSDGLSIEEQTGLFAELTFLLQVCHGLLSHYALDAWRGPVGGSKDFLVNQTAIEIKATTAP
jgi:hypothetical protein